MDQSSFTKSDYFFDMKSMPDFNNYSYENSNALNFDSYDDNFCFDENNLEMFPDYFEDNFLTSNELENTEITSCQNKKNNENEVQSVPDIDFNYTTSYTKSIPQVSHQPINSYYSEKLFNYNNSMSKSYVKSSLSIEKEIAIATNGLSSASKNSIESLNRNTLFFSSLNSKKHLNKNGNPKKKPGRKVKVPDFLLPPEEAQKRRLRRERNKVAAAKCRNKRKETAYKLEEETKKLEKEHQYLKNVRKCLMEEKNKLQEMLCSHEQNNYCMFKFPIEDSLPINK